MISETNERRSKPRKTVSFAVSDQFYIIEYQEPIFIEGGSDYPVNNDIESMISGDETSTSHVSFDALDKLSAGTAFDTTTFNAFPRRLSAESVGPAGFSMDDVIQKLLNIQACSAARRDSISSLDSSVDSSSDSSCLVQSISEGEGVVNEEDGVDDGDRALSPEDSTSLLNECLDSKVQRVTSDSVIGAGPCLFVEDIEHGVQSPHSKSESLISSGKDMNITAGLPPEFLIELAATPRRDCSSQFHLSPAGSNNHLLCMECDASPTDTTPLTVSSSAKEGIGSSFNAGPTGRAPLVQSGIGQLQQVSATQFRRRERLRRHQSVAIDMAKGVEKYCKWRLLFNSLLLWLLLPALTCSIMYGVVPYDYFIKNDPNKSNANVEAIVPSTVWAVTLLPWLLVMSAAAGLSLEIYSLTISQIELGVVTWEESPTAYAWAGLGAVGASMAMQSLLFTFFGVGHMGSWIAIICTGFLVIIAVLFRMFLIARQFCSIESRISFRKCVMGILVLLVGGSIAYTEFAILYSQFSIASGHAVGYLLALIFPLLKSFLACLVENCPSTRWGGHRDGLCAGSIVTIVAAVWHGVFGCLIIATCTVQGQYVVLAIVEFIIEGIALMEMLTLPAHTPSSLALEDLNSLVDVRLKCKNGNKNPLQSQSSTSWKSKTSVSPDSRNNESLISMEKGLKERSDSMLSSESRSNRWSQVRRQVSFNWTRSTSCTSNLTSSKGSRKIVHPYVNLLSKIRRKRLRTEEDNSREIVLATWLSVTWVAGILTPIAFLICSTVVSVGWNRRLFALEIIDDNKYNDIFALASISDWEIRSSLHRIWSLNVFDHTGPSKVVTSLLSISLYHLILMLIGSSLLSNFCLGSDKSQRYREEEKLAEIEVGRTNNNNNRAENAAADSSFDIWGVYNTLLEYHFNTIALSTIMTMAVVFSVVFPWYGMNSSF